MPFDDLLHGGASAFLGLGLCLLTLSVLRERRRLAQQRITRFVAEEPPTDEDLENPRRGWPWLTSRLADMGVFLAAAPAWLLAVLPVLAILALTWGLAVALGIGMAALLLFFLFGRGRDLRTQMERQAPTAIAVLSSGLRAGYSVPQAVALVAQESPEPTASQFTRVKAEIDLGIGLEESFTHLSRRTGNIDYQLVSVLVAVQHEVGGNLAQTLDAVAETLTERFEIRQQVAALTAQQRLSAWVLTSLPIVVFCFLWVVNRPFLDPMLTTPVGWLLLAAVGLLSVLGTSAMRVVGRVEV